MYYTNTDDFFYKFFKEGCEFRTEIPNNTEDLERITKDIVTKIQQQREIPSSAEEFKNVIKNIAHGIELREKESIFQDVLSFVKDGTISEEGARRVIFTFSDCEGFTPEIAVDIKRAIRRSQEEKVSLFWQPDIQNMYFNWLWKEAGVGGMVLEAQEEYEKTTREHIKSMECEILSSARDKPTWTPCPNCKSLDNAKKYPN